MKRLSSKSPKIVDEGFEVPETKTNQSFVSSGKLTSQTEVALLVRNHIEPINKKFKIGPLPSQNIDNFQEKETVDTEKLRINVEKNPPTSSSFTCPICFSECQELETVKPLSCKHQFCLECTSIYLKRQIDQFHVVKIVCPQDQCKNTFNDADIQKIVDKQTFEDYKRKKALKLRNRDTRIKYCPNPHCHQPFSPNLEYYSTKCNCGTEICNSCFKPVHKGQPCIDVIVSDSETYFENNNIKKCYVCKTIIEKQAGCDHISCPVCDYEWCWNCGREWEPGHGSRCLNRWSPQPPKKMQERESLSCMDELFNGIFLILEILMYGFTTAIAVIFVWPCIMVGEFQFLLEKKNIKSVRVRKILSFIMALITWPIAVILFPIGAIYEEYGICCRKRRWVKGNLHDFGFQSKIHNQRRNIMHKLRNKPNRRISKTREYDENHVKVNIIQVKSSVENIKEHTINLES